MASEFDTNTGTETLYHGHIDEMDDWARQMVWRLQGEMSAWDHIMGFVDAVNWTGTVYQCIFVILYSIYLCDQCWNP